MKIGKELALIAKKKEICQEWFDRMKTLGDKNQLLEMYVRGTDFCLSNNFPTNDYIREDFVGRMEEHGMHPDKPLDMANDRRIVTLGRCTGRVEINNFGVSEISVKYESDLIIIAKRNSFAMINVFDDSKLRVITPADSRVCVDHYNGTLKIESSERVVIKVIEKYKKTH